MKLLIGEQIRKLREARKVTQEDISYALGMTRQRFARIEKGIADISYDNILAIAKYLNVAPQQITDVCDNKATVSYRSGNASAASFEKIEEMITFFYANKSLYKRMHLEVDR